MISLVHHAVLLASLCFVAAQDTSSNCSIGIGRFSGSDVWDLTVYNVPQAAHPQDWNIIATLKSQKMGKGDSITVPTSAGVPQTITIANMDDAPVFDYVLAEQSEGFEAHWEDPNFAKTKTLLQFSVPDAKYNWTTADCGATSVVESGGFEGWNCDFPCSAAATTTKEL